MYNSLWRFRLKKEILHIIGKLIPIPVQFLGSKRACHILNSTQIFSYPWDWLRSVSLTDHFLFSSLLSLIRPYSVTNAEERTASVGVFFYVALIQLQFQSKGLWCEISLVSWLLQRKSSLVDSMSIRTVLGNFLL